MKPVPITTETITAYIGAWYPRFVHDPRRSDVAIIACDQAAQLVLTTIDRIRRCAPPWQIYEEANLTYRPRPSRPPWHIATPDGRTHSNGTPSSSSWTSAGTWWTN